MSVLAKLREVAALLDDAALAALASKGLVRRARKDLEARAPAIAHEAADAVLVTVEECTVRLVARPADATCTCPATGVCRHVLAAWIWLAAGANAATAPSGAVPEVLAVDEAALHRWAGVALERRALRELAEGLAVTCADGPVAVFAIPAWNAECRWVPGGGLAGMLCSCHAPSPCVHRVASVLACQVQAGQRALPAAGVLEASAEAPRTREQVLGDVRAATEELVRHGLSRLSPAEVQRVRGLATSAHGVDLPRLERTLSALADQVGATLAGSAAASEEALLVRAATAHALATALRKPSPALVGRHRNRYERVGELVLTGVGARAWRSPAGYTGLTVYFHEAGGGGWHTWTEARPVDTRGFDPVARFAAPGPWDGAVAPRLVSASHGRLRSAWRARSGRLSGRPGTTFLRLEPTALAHLPPPLASWREVAARARAALAQGLAERDEAAAHVLLKPAAWGAPSFDALAQELVVPLRDAEGRTLQLVLEHAPETHAAIRALESFAWDGHALFGLLTLRRGRLAVTPISAIGAGGVVSFGLTDGAGRGPAGDSLDPDDDALDDAGDDAWDAHWLEPADPVSRVLVQAWAELEAATTAGCAAFHAWDAIAVHAHRAGALGLAHAARMLRGVMPGPAAPRAILAAAWVVHLTAGIVTLETAAGRLE